MKKPERPPRIRELFLELDRRGDHPHPLFLPVLYREGLGPPRGKQHRRDLAAARHRLLQSIARPPAPA